VADASSSGTYKAMMSEIMDVCSDNALQIVELPGQTGGATDNLQALVNNRVQAALLHSDVIFASAMADPSLKQLKTLVALYPEEIHVLALRHSRTKRRVVQTVEFTTLADLAGYKVGAAGGGVLTARILSGQGEGHFDVVPFLSGKDVLPALDAGEIQAAIFVGGSPLPNLVPLSGDQYKLLPIPEAITNHLAGVTVYRPAIINYPNLNSGSIKTLAPQATILTRRYTLPKLVEPQARFRSCFYAHLEELQQTPGKHPKWQLVDPKDHGGWEWYELPTGSR
jgi:TRAP-type uncharacterized transport system substrate-binding protein